MHLGAFDQLHNVKVSHELFTAFLVDLLSNEGLPEFLGYLLEFAAAEKLGKQGFKEVSPREGELFSIQDQLVEEVKLLAGRFVVDKVALDAIFDEFLHLVFTYVNEPVHVVAARELSNLTGCAGSRFVFRLPKTLSAWLFFLIVIVVISKLKRFKLSFGESGLFTSHSVNGRGLEKSSSLRFFWGQRQFIFGIVLNAF